MHNENIQWIEEMAYVGIFLFYLLFFGTHVTFPVLGSLSCSHGDALGSLEVFVVGIKKEMSLKHPLYTSLSPSLVSVEIRGYKAWQEVWHQLCSCKRQSQFFLLHNLGTCALVIKQCTRQRKITLSAAFTLTPKRNVANRVKENEQHSGTYQSDQSRLFDSALHILLKE